MKKGKFIVIEGLDGCGKSTISTILQKTYNADLLNALPKKIKHWLEIVGSTKHPEATFSYFTLCNLLKSQEIESIILSGRNVILDRYFYTTYVYHQEIIKVNFPTEIKDFYKNLIQPDLVIFLDVPQEIRKERIKSRKGELQWFGDAISIKKDLTNIYFKLFSDLNTKFLSVDNHKNNIEQSIKIINLEIDQLK
jgi:dTMP kinase